MASEELNNNLRALKKNHIVAAARQLFFSKGYENVTIIEIAKKAGMSKSTLYTYVKSKEDLFMTIHIEGMKLRKELFLEAMGSKQTGYEKIYSFGEVYFNFFKNNPGYFKLYMYEDYNNVNKDRVEPELYEEFDELLNELIDFVRNAFYLGISDGSLKSNLNVGYCDKYLAYNLRTMLNVAFSPDKVKQLDENFDDREFYFQYLDMFMEFVKKADI
jgi:TetR/AcrR family transcriptional regulator